MKGEYNPVSKGVWDKRRHPAKLSDKAKSNKHITMRTKGKSPYPTSNIKLV